MSSILGAVSFLNPWILTGLLALPLLWCLLRIMPPRPQIIALPTTRFLIGLVPDKQTPHHTPWWILLLRLLIAALVILALSHPVLNQSSQITSQGAIRILIDNGWSAATNWEQKTRTAQDLITEAGRRGKEVHIATTARQPGSDHMLYQGPVSAAEALSLLRALTPLPWAADYKTLQTLIEDKPPTRSPHSYFLSDGLDGAGLEPLMRRLQNQGGLDIFRPDDAHLPLILKAPHDNNYAPLKTSIHAPRGTTHTSGGYVQALSEDGRILDQKSLSLAPGIMSEDISFDVPESLRNEVARLRISGQNSAAALYTLDQRFQKRDVGLIGPEDKQSIKPYIEAHYYLIRALEPFSKLHQGGLETVLAHSPAVIIMPDIANISTAQLNTLEEWTKDGGLLLRFAGPNMADASADNALTPVNLRRGGRALDGALTWSSPAKIAAFSSESPFYGIDLYEPVSVRRQILAEPSAELDRKTWGRLEDGTPLITADTLGKGLIVMVHTTASPDWSDLPLSGAFVEILQRVVNMAGTSRAKVTNQGGPLKPIWVYDSEGRITAPEGWAQSIDAAEFSKTAPDSRHPPGLYGSSSFQRALNLGPHLEPEVLPSLPATIGVHLYDRDYETDLLPLLLYAAVILLLLDGLITFVISLNLRSLAALTAVLAVLMITPAQAQDTDVSPEDITYADGLYLAYIQTGDERIDALSLRGLENLGTVLKRRTSVEPDGVASLNPEIDTLAFFPLIYWPVTPAQPPLSNEALKKLQDYLSHGGTILFDTQERDTNGSNSAVLRDRLAGLNIPALAPVPDNHVLMRSFYLINSFPGIYNNTTLWIEQQSVSGRDGVSSVIIGSNDWAGTWAAGGNGPGSFIGSSSRQQELSYRFGVNLVIYALTGNYKADQVHVPYILERLGQ